MDLALVGVALRMARKRPFVPRERPVEALAIALGAAYVLTPPSRRPSLD